MLIIDMPMPKCCADCHMIALSDRGMICLCAEELLEIDYDKKRPSWCPIKGELVRCGECIHRYVDGENVRFNVCELNHNKVQADNWFCADGERTVLND